MSIFRLSIVLGTEEVVEKELLSKFPKAEIVGRTKGKIDFQVEGRVLGDFSSLLSPLRIQDTNRGDEDLYKRGWRKAFVPAGINPSLAYVLCDLAELNEDDVVLDPFCGGSTIPITAVMYFGIKKAFASDISGKAVDISLENWKASGVKKDKFVLFRSNVSTLKLSPKSITKVITNMPFGIRVGNHEMNKKLYRNFAFKLNRLLKDDGSAIVLTQEKELFEEVMKNDFEVSVEMTPEVGGLRPNVYKVTRKSVKYFVK
ncbi:TPA: hypothetical protein DCP77_01310 [Candidatus Collierbacteria bacterium]|uniref:THUMP domain-containing protein 3 n=1 Tax=Candidatus Collierbacteria bacterium GW2011_GWA2_42_17 TaxID=1618378 RepID=A0A0G1B9M0_9BACT|nr:MAG: THUMP domain-containing protein 3 [Candidatus Collierbacteria bacterium GW2011_GWB2_42_12]KKS43031.1 MAG: THUMP domain-containing protein 3 [Candidatus Collierbacteria bacterium GW2011_GWA2_42_17]KKS62912.1 MAG: THUMP domain-containing protein 3 [Candidatus Collierbacteria bacterium GW2011_GWE2_42_48]KKS63459.1 MAG: THUMP domain-containing protein 3 [Candidatus Collierbacteria bacterium GW2011_GWD2_42_50]KKS64534.1 MAG: THUMP domain-containing protein 3 [Candidatus Collierbacteria bacte